ncbi:MAG: tetratricopeptide repeat protein [Opitutaceae bacterium]|nr:tetratricopeptide repeat protein [Opitutaceae bacterium]
MSPAAFTLALRGAALVAAVALAYWGALAAPFFFDDADAVVNNPTLRGGLRAALAPPADGSAVTGRPLVNATFALDHALHGLSPRGFRLANVALHAASTLLLFGLIRRLLSSANAQPSTFNPTAAIAAAAWSLHPLQTESVICIAQRTELLCGFFYLLTLYAFARGWLVLSGVACLFGMASKEVMVTAPLVVLLLDRTFVAGSFAAAWRARRGYYLALAATWLLLAALVVSAGGSRGVAAGFNRGISSWSYLLTQAEALVLYVRLALWPHPLVLDYGTAVAPGLGAVWGQGLLVLAALAATVWALVRRPVLGFFGAAFFLILAPSSSVVPLVTQTLAEHRMYLPLAALTVGFALLVQRHLAVGLLVVLVLGGATALRTRDYRDAVTIWSDTVAKRPLNARAHHNLALAQQAGGDVEAAHRAFARVIELAPDYAPARFNGGVALLARGRFAEASAQLAEAARLSPALRNEAKFADAQFELGRLAERDGDLAAAEAKFREALDLAPDHLGARSRLGLMFARAGRLEPAAAQFRAVIAARPADAEAHANLGNVLLLLGRPREALASYETADRLKPGDPRTAENIRLAREALR